MFKAELKSEFPNEVQLASNFSLKLRGDGRLTVIRENALGSTAVAVSVKRCFPWSQPLTWLSLRDDQGREVELIEDVDAPNTLDVGSRGELLKALEEAAFVFAVQDIISVTEEFELRQWRVRLREGERVFQTRLNSWPRELAGGGLLIQDVGNDLYLIADLEALPLASQKKLWAFMDD